MPRHPGPAAQHGRPGPGRRRHLPGPGLRPPHRPAHPPAQAARTLMAEPGLDHQAVAAVLEAAGHHPTRRVGFPASPAARSRSCGCWSGAAPSGRSRPSCSSPPPRSTPTSPTSTTRPACPPAPAPPSSPWSTASSTPPRPPAGPRPTRHPAPVDTGRLTGSSCCFCDLRVCCRDRAGSCGGLRLSAEARMVAVSGRRCRPAGKRGRRSRA